MPHEVDSQVKICETTKIFNIRNFACSYLADASECSKHVAMFLYLNRYISFLYKNFIYFYN